MKLESFVVISFVMAPVDSGKIHKNDHLKIISSLNNYCICNHCNKKLKNKLSMQQHLKTCLLSRTCSWCNIVFKNRGNLVTHAFYVHGDTRIPCKIFTKHFKCECANSYDNMKNDLPSNEVQHKILHKDQNTNDGTEEDYLVMRPPTTTLVLKSVKKTAKILSCDVCSKVFSDSFRLTCHIRDIHFNLLSKSASYEDKQLNQVWFEKVLNSSKIVEMKKAGNNVILIRTLEDDKKVTVQDNKTVIDVRNEYPTHRRNGRAVCHLCKKTMLKRVLQKHYNEKHAQVKKHHCNNCNRSFKRSHFYVRHVCHKSRKKRAGNKTVAPA